METPTQNLDLQLVAQQYAWYGQPKHHEYSSGPPASDPQYYHSSQYQHETPAPPYTGYVEPQAPIDIHPRTALPTHQQQGNHYMAAVPLQNYQEGYPMPHGLEPKTEGVWDTIEAEYPDRQLEMWEIAEASKGRDDSPAGSAIGTHIDDLMKVVQSKRDTPPVESIVSPNWMSHSL